MATLSYSKQFFLLETIRHKQQLIVHAKLIGTSFTILDGGLQRVSPLLDLLLKGDLSNKYYHGALQPSIGEAQQDIERSTPHRNDYYPKELDSCPK